MKTKDEVIDELASLVVIQDKLIKELNAKLDRLKGYLEVYENAIKEVRR